MQTCAVCKIIRIILLLLLFKRNKLIFVLWYYFISEVIKLQYFFLVLKMASWMQRVHEASFKRLVRV